MTLKKFPFYAIWLGGSLAHYDFRYDDWSFYIVFVPVVILIARNNW